MLLEGEVCSIPLFQGHLSQFDFKLSKINDTAVQAKIRLSAYTSREQFMIGQCWRLSAKLKRPHALRNPGCFDVEKFYFQHKIRAVGSMLKEGRNIHLSATTLSHPIEQIRYFLQKKILRHLKENPFCGMVLALTLGMTHLITQEQWQVFRETGTNHLVAISGLHIGLVAKLISKITALIWVRVPYGPLLIPTPHIAGIVGILSALAYGLLAGLSASTERSVIMITFLVLTTLCYRKVSTFNAMTISLALIVLVDPFATLSMGFWLSFLAVTLLIYGMNSRLNPTGAWWKWGRAQWVVTMGMMPTLLLFFQQSSLLAVPANILAVPWISFLVVPSCLLGLGALMISDKLGGWLLHFSTYLLQVIWLYLEKLTHLSTLIWHHAFFNLITACFTHLAAYVTLLPNGLIFRLVAIVYWLPFLTAAPAPIPPNSIRFTVLDVGQGLATVIQTERHTVIFDTGAKLNDNFDMGKAVVIPYLRHLGIKKIDVLTVSHGDNDHIGGADSILKAFPVSHIITSVPLRFKGLHPQLCEEKIKWEWDGIAFKFLSPFKNSNLTGNNSSCVLKITKDQHSILLTGDIERPAEEYLISRHATELPATILVAPHHGSKTSSTEGFINNVRPHYVIFSCGYLNTYKHPHLEVVRRYLKRKIILYNTVFSGAITMTLSPYSDKVLVQEYRPTHQKIWHQKDLE